MREVTFLLILSLLCVAPAIAQSPSATINGIVLDPSGAAIAGAQIVVVNDVTGVQYTTKTNGEGIYVVPNLPPGPYRIQVSNSGFKTIIKPDIIIHVQDALAINFTLPIGAASEIMTVTGGAPLINTENSAVSTVIDRKFVESLPLNGRSFNTLLQLTPGVTIVPVGSGLGQFSIAGQRTDANNFTVDGVSANFGVVDGPAPRETGSGSVQAFSALGGTSSLVSVEALQEFRIETSSFAPEFGRTPGGQVILTTRSGANDLHGALYDYFRNDIFDANDWFANAAGKARAPERHNDFGGFLGGRIVKDRTFYFISYEGARLRIPKAQAIQVPSAWARTVAAPAALAPFLDAYPEPDDPTVTPNIFSSRFTGVWSNAATLNAGSVRIDHTLSSKFTVFGRYNDAPSDVTSRFFGLSTVSPINVNTRTVTAGLDAFLTSRVSNTFRGNYSTSRASNAFFLDSFGGALPPPSGLLFGSLSAQDNEAGLSIGDANLYLTGPSVKNTTRQINFVDAFSLSMGPHVTKYGIDYRGIDLSSFPHQHLLSYSTPSVQQFLSSNGQVSMSAGTSASARVRSQALSLFAQDSWKVSPRATLTYGVRWELSPAPEALDGTTLASWSEVQNPAQITLAPSGTPLWHTTYGNFAPRFGVAYAIPSAGTSGPARLLTKDWSVDTVVVARSGFPFNAFNFINSPDPNGNALVRPDRVPGQPSWLNNQSAPGGKSVNPNAFSTPSTVRQGTEGRNDIPGFGLTEVDVSIARNFPIKDRFRLQFRTDAFNVFNHPNFTNPQGFFQFGAIFLQSQKMLNQGLGGLNPLFQEGGPRSLQLSLKFSF